MEHAFARFDTAASNAAILIFLITQVRLSLLSLHRFNINSKWNFVKVDEILIIGVNSNVFCWILIGVSSIFYFVAAISIIQLALCCVAEYYRLKQPSLLSAFRLTTQKLLYFVIFIAALLRGAYFTTPVSRRCHSGTLNLAFIIDIYPFCFLFISFCEIYRKHYSLIGHRF